jgi:hypothetical protein
MLWLAISRLAIQLLEYKLAMTQNMRWLAIVILLKHLRCPSLVPGIGLKVHKKENFFGSDFEYCTFSLLVLLKYSDFVNKTVW